MVALVVCVRLMLGVWFVWNNIVTVLSYSSTLHHKLTTFMMRNEVATRRLLYENHSRRTMIPYQRRQQTLSSSTFVLPSVTALRYTNKNIDETTTSTSSSSSSSSSLASSTTVVTTIAATSLTGVIVDITFLHHRPLGCVIEESLVNPTSAATATTATATSTATNHIVFVTSVTANGFAEKAGLLVGDVIVGVSTAFTTSSTDTKSDEECHLSSSSTTIMDVTGFGIDRVKSLVMCRYDTEPFTLRVLRGSTALQDHETALTELCSNPDTTSTEAEQCMIDYIQSGYAIADNPAPSSDKVVNVDGTIGNDECIKLFGGSDSGDDGECLLNDLHSLWASDLPISTTLQRPQNNMPLSSNGAIRVDTSDNVASSSAVKPWSSRASPSGTFVRDPTTGKMKNVDAND